MNGFQYPKRRSGFPLGLFILFPTLWGITYLCPSVQAQPTLTQPTLTPPINKSPKFLSVEQKANLNKLVGISRTMYVCGLSMDLKVENSTLEDVVTRIKQLFPNQTIALEVRGATPIRVSFDLKKVDVGSALTSIAALAGCKLYVLSSGMLVAPPFQLSEAERLEMQNMRGGEWMSNSDVGIHKVWTTGSDTLRLPLEQKAITTCGLSMDLKVENSTLEDVVTRIKQLFPNQTIALEVRGATPIRVSFDLKKVDVGSALTSIAALAGCKLYVLSSGMLVAPPSLLSEAERLEMQNMRGGEWMSNAESRTHDTGIPVRDGLKVAGWTIRREARQLFAKSITQELTGSDTNAQPPIKVKTTFDKFSPDSQAMLSEMVN